MCANSYFSPMMSLCWCPAVSSLGTSGFSRSFRNSSRLSASPPFLLFLSSSGTSGVRHLVNIWREQKKPIEATCR